MGGPYFWYGFWYGAMVRLLVRWLVQYGQLVRFLVQWQVRLVQVLVKLAHIIIHTSYTIQGLESALCGAQDSQVCSVGAEHVAAAQGVLRGAVPFQEGFSQPCGQAEGHCLGANAGQMGSGSVLDQTFDCTKVAAFPLFFLRAIQC